MHGGQFCSSPVWVSEVKMGINYSGDSEISSICFFHLKHQVPQKESPTNNKSLPGASPTALQSSAIWAFLAHGQFLQSMEIGLQEIRNAWKPRHLAGASCWSGVWRRFRGREDMQALAWGHRP